MKTNNNSPGMEQLGEDKEHSIKQITKLLNLHSVHIQTLDTHHQILKFIMQLTKGKYNPRTVVETIKQYKDRNT